MAHKPLLVSYRMTGCRTGSPVLQEGREVGKIIDVDGDQVKAAITCPVTIDRITKGAAVVL